MIPTIDSQTLGALPLADLVQRMDDILRCSVIERYGVIHHGFSLDLVSHIIETKRVRARPEVEQRRLAHIAFSYLVQLELGSIASGIANALLYNDQYDEKSSWQSPAFRLRDGAIDQYQIVSGRIAMEIFIDLLHCIDTGQRLEKKKSKLKAFRKWLCDTDNQFHYFAHVLLTAYRFDREMRTPEVHGTPKLPKRLLLLQNPSEEESNQRHRLTNTLSGCWRPLLEILNEKRPSYMHGDVGGEWFDAYMNGTEEEVISKLDSMFDGIE